MPDVLTLNADENRGWVLGLSDEAASTPCSGTVVILCGRKKKPRILRTVDGGASWLEQDLKLDPALTSVALTVLDANRAVVTQGQSLARVTTDGGATWSAAQYPPAAVLPSGRVWAISNTGSLLVSDDLGITSTREFILAGRVDAVQFVDNLVGMAHARPTDAANAARHLIYRTADGGATWASTSAQGLPDIAPLDDYGARIVASDSQVSWLTLNRTLPFGVQGPTAPTYRSTDGGARWTLVPTPSAISGFRMQPISASSAWIAAETGMFLTRDAGLNWVSLAKPGGGSSEQPFDLQSGQSGLFVGYASSTLGTNRWFRTSSDGATSGTLFDPPLRTAKAAGDAARISHFFDLTRGMASIGNDLYETVDGGRTWSLKLAELADVLPYFGIANAARLQFTAPLEGWLLLKSRFARTIDGGVTWTQLDGPPIPGPSALAGDLDCRSDGQCILVMDLGPSTESRPTPGAVSRWRAESGWTPLVSLAVTPKSVRWVSTTVAVAVGLGGAIIRSSDGGQTWSERASGVSKDLLRLSFVSSTQGWAVGDGGTVMRSTDAGLTWSVVTVPTTAKLSDVVFPDALNGYIVGDTGTVLATHDGGITWTLQVTGTRQDIAAIYSPQPGVVRMMTREGHVFASATGGY